MKNCVLLTSGGRKVPLLRCLKDAVKEILPSWSVIVGDSNCWAVAQFFADNFWQMPLIADECFDEILDGLKKRNIKIVLPTRDAELIFWSKNSMRLQDVGIHVIVSRRSSVELCLDKLAFASSGIEQNLNIIPTSAKLADIEGEVVVVKERFGSGSRSIGLGLNREEALKHSLNLQNPIFQPFIHGVEISIDAWLDSDCRIKGLVLRRRDSVLNGESEISTTFRDEALEMHMANFLTFLKLNGPVVLQAILCADNEFKVIECNPRIGGASTLGIAAGVLSLHWSLLDATGMSLENQTFRPIQYQLRQIRTKVDTYIASDNF